jgi:hypothetical protein
LVDQRKWELEEADLEATPKEEGPGYGGKITFKASSTISAVRLESFFRYCKPEFKHWEAYDNLIMEIYSPPDQQGSTALRTPLTLQVKDGAGRRFKMPISPTAEKGKPVTINVFKIGEEINVADVNQIVLFTPTSLVADQTVFLNYIKLVSSGVTETTGPFVIFKGLQVEQNKIKPGESVVFTATFSITNPFRSNYNLYIHIYRAKDSAGWISINKDPRIPTNQWPVNQDVVEGPFSVPIPPNASAGIYNIEMGLFIPITLSSPKAKYLKYRRGKNGIYYVSEPTFPVDYIKQPYVNYEEYGDWVVGTFEVLPPE